VANPPLDYLAAGY